MQAMELTVNNNNFIGANRKHFFAADESLQHEQQHLCAGCSLPIRDRYLLQVMTWPFRVGRA